MKISKQSTDLSAVVGTPTTLPTSPIKAIQTGSTTPGALPRWVRARLERLLPLGPNGNREGRGRR
jgi:hypothetical protein